MLCGITEHPLNCILCELRTISARNGFCRARLNFAALRSETKSKNTKCSCKWYLCSIHGRLVARNSNISITYPKTKKMWNCFFPDELQITYMKYIIYKSFQVKNKQLIKLLSLSKTFA